MKKISIFLAGAALAFLAGCVNCNCTKKCPYGTTEYKEIPHAVVTLTDKPVVLDGKLDDPVWQSTPACNMDIVCGSDAQPEPIFSQIHKDKFEKCFVKFATDGKYLYMGGTAEDHDIFQYDDKNQSHAYTGGDVIELFLKPVNASYYWELYITPANYYTTFFYLSPGASVARSFSDIHYIEGLKGGVQIDGTFNVHNDTDNEWTFELAVPLDALAAKGIEFKPGEPWTIFASRYNYGVHFRSTQHSAFPRVPRLNFHALEFYAPVDFK